MTDILTAADRARTVLANAGLPDTVKVEEDLIYLAPHIYIAVSWSGNGWDAVSSNEDDIEMLAEKDDLDAAIVAALARIVS